MKTVGAFFAILDGHAASHVFSYFFNDFALNLIVRIPGTGPKMLILKLPKVFF